MKRLCGLWVKDKKGGDGRFMSGKVTEDITIKAGSTIFVFRNERRDNDRQPTHNLSIGEPDGGQRQPEQGQGEEFY